MKCKNLRLYVYNISIFKTCVQFAYVIVNVFITFTSYIFKIYFHICNKEKIILQFEIYCSGIVIILQGSFNRKLPNKYSKDIIDNQLTNANNLITIQQWKTCSINKLNNTIYIHTLNGIFHPYNTKSQLYRCCLRLRKTIGRHFH